MPRVGIVLVVLMIACKRSITKLETQTALTFPVLGGR